MENSTLHQIKVLRKKYSLNQKELAEKAGVSQSLVAKIEAGKIDPSFTKAQQIFVALQQLHEKKEIKAYELMNQKVIFVQDHDQIHKVIKIMRSKGISQVPVLSKKNICGLVTESVLLQKIAEHPEKAGSLTIREIMEDAPPIISPKTGLKTIIELLRESPIIIVAEKGDIKGIISKTDVLGKME